MSKNKGKTFYRIDNRWIEIFYRDGMPSVKLKNYMTLKGWNWDRKRCSWKNVATFENIALAEEMCPDNTVNDEANREDLIQEYRDLVLNTVYNYTDYTENDISISSKAPISCCNGIQLKQENKLLTISSDNQSLNISGYYCPRCFKLFFRNKNINKSVSKKSETVLNDSFKDVSIGYFRNGKRINISPQIVDNTSYREKYGRNIKMHVLVRAFVNNKSLSSIESTFRQYGYILKDINNLPVSEDLNNSLFDIFKVDSVDNLCALSSDDISSYVMGVVNADEPDRVYYREDLNESVKKCYTCFKYKISGEKNLTFLIACADIKNQSRNPKCKLLNKDVSVELRTNLFSTYYTISVKDKSCFGILTQKKKYKKYCDNVKKGFFDDTNYYEDNSITLLHVADFLVRSTAYGCTNNKHNLIRINAAVRVKTRDGIVEVIIPASFCEKCNRYYILERDYESLKKYGYICCKIDTFESVMNNSGNAFSTFQDKSILSLYGYNVNQQTGLSDATRHRILDFIIDNGIQTQFQVISRLEQNINLRRYNIHMGHAIGKWKEDIEYVRKRQKVAGIVRVDSITVPVKRIRLV